MAYVVAAYDVDRVFGGPEEGGWWYDAGELVRVLRTFRNEDRAYDYARRLNARLQSRSWGPNEGRRDIGSVLSEGEIQALVFERTAPETFPRGRQVYQ